MEFAHQHDKEKCERFGLTNGQMRSDFDAFFQKNRHWIIEGERSSFGYGDLSLQDLERIQSVLADDEVFLGWQESHGTRWQQTDLPMVRVTKDEISFPHFDMRVSR